MLNESWTVLSPTCLSVMVFSGIPSDSEWNGKNRTSRVSATHLNVGDAKTNGICLNCFICFIRAAGAHTFDAPGLAGCPPRDHDRVHDSGEQWRRVLVLAAQALGLEWLDAE